MPFINISFTEANQTLKDPKFILNLLKDKKINPKEADLLELLSDFAKNPSSSKQKDIEDFCKKIFPKSEFQDAFEKICRFIESENKRVAWVIFSRTHQLIPYDDRDPLEDYNPRVSEVLTISSKYKTIE